jgi:hypothetical protein
MKRLFENWNGRKVSSIPPLGGNEETFPRNADTMEG